MVPEDFPKRSIDQIHLRQTVVKIVKSLVDFCFRVEVRVVPKGFVAHGKTITFIDQTASAMLLATAHGLFALGRSSY